MSMDLKTLHCKRNQKRKDVCAEIHETKKLNLNLNLRPKPKPKG